MKNKIIFLLGSALFSIHFAASAQDSSRHSAASKINKTSAATDNLQGKKIQQQTLSANRIEKLDSVAKTTRQAKKKTVVKPKRKNA